MHVHEPWSSWTVVCFLFDDSLAVVLVLVVVVVVVGIVPLNDIYDNNDIY